MRYGNRKAALAWIVGLAIPFLLLKPPSAWAQADSLADWVAKEKAGGFAEPLKPNNTVRLNELSRVLRTGNFDNQAQQQLFTNLFEQRLFAHITNPKARGEREDVIAMLRSYFSRVPAGSPVFDKLTEITLAYMSKIAEDPKWHPAVRIDAVLAIGEVKSPLAVTMLLKAARYGQLTDKGQTNNTQLNWAFRVAAMRGLIHLAERDPLRPTEPSVLDNSSEATQAIDWMADVAGAKPRQPPQPDSVRWMRGQAADALGAIGSTGTANKVPDKLIVMLGDQDLPLALRGKAAWALGRLQYQGGLPDAAAYLQAVAGYGSDALADNQPTDAKRVKAVARDIAGEPPRSHGALSPLLTQAAVPKAVHDIEAAMKDLQQQATDTATPEALKEAIAKAKAVLDAARKK